MLSYYFFFMFVFKFGLIMIYMYFFCNEWNEDIKKIYWKLYIDIIGKLSRNEKIIYDDGYEVG